MKIEDKIRKAKMICEICGYELLISEEFKIVFCQNCKRQVKPKS